MQSKIASLLFALLVVLALTVLSTYYAYNPLANSICANNGGQYIAGVTMCWYGKGQPMEFDWFLVVCLLGCFLMLYSALFLIVSSLIKKRVNRVKKD